MRQLVPVKLSNLLYDIRVRWTGCSSDGVGLGVAITCRPYLNPNRVRLAVSET
jgi:hypothetical protein